MRISCFCHTYQLEELKASGFDAAELDIMELSRMGDPEFLEFRRKCSDSGLTFEAFSGFMPLDERIHSQHFDMQKWVNHARRMGERTAELGAKVWPLGAGKCRSIPEGVPQQEAAQKVGAFFAKICGTVEEFGILIAVEPLGLKNSNFLNTINEGADFAQNIGANNCKTMCDLRHMTSMGESMTEIVKHASMIAHAHIDYPLGPDRCFPNETDGFDYRPYIGTLDEAGCCELLGVEATSYVDFSMQAPQCARYLRKLLATTRSR